MSRNTIVILIISLIISINMAVCYAAGDKINFTEEELSFIKAHPIIQIGVDPKFIPFEFIDEDGEYKGIAKDYLDLVSEKTGLTFEIEKGLTWPEAYDMALRGELDAVPSVGRTPEREEFFILSEPYYYFKRVIATKDTDKQISSIEDLEGYAVAVQRNSSHHSYLLDHDKINLSLYDSVESALAAVATGEEIAFVGNLATTNYVIRSNGLSNLRFVSFEADKQQALHFAARKDWPQLVSIFNKAVASISDKEKNEINNKWIDLDTQLDYGPILRVVKVAGGFFAVILAVSAFWILRLRKEIKRRKQIQEELEKISMLDGLTGISNRRYFDSFLQKLWGINMRERFPIALIMIDIDNFKKYNDTYGHLEGDQCLKNVAAMINDTVRRPGDFVARYGGEEFAVLLSNTKENGAANLAERIREKIERMSIEVKGKNAPVTVSLGVASIVTIKGRGPTDLIEAADSALYEAKKTGKNKVVKASEISAEFGED